MSVAPFPARARQSCVLGVARVAFVAAASWSFAAASPALAAGPQPDDEVSPFAEKTAVDKPAAEPDPFRTKPGYMQLFATAFVGQGLRFNNPYRLATPLGDDAESLSKTAPYVDVGLGATFGNPLGVQHGAALRTSIATQGVAQVVMTPSYLAWRRWSAIAVYGRAGVPLVFTPDVTWGLEAGVGATWFFLGGFGLAAEMIGDVFYGAGTREKATVTYPVLSGQLGFVISYEVLP